MKDKKQYLTNLYQKNNLAHFYHLKCSSPVGDQQILSWTSEWLSSLGVKNEHSHSDILWIPEEEPESGFYHVKDISTIFRFNEYQPLELKYKFIIIKNASKLTTTVSNKLLKVLEEPSKNTVIFLLNPSSVQLLPTISSRSLTLNIELKNNSEHLDLVQEISAEIAGGITLNQFIEKYKKTADIDSRILKGVLVSPLKAQTAKLLELTRSLEEAQMYHSAMSSRLVRIYHFFK